MAAAGGVAATTACDGGEPTPTPTSSYKRQPSSRTFPSEVLQGFSLENGPGNYGRFVNEALRSEVIIRTEATVSNKRPGKDVVLADLLSVSAFDNPGDLKTLTVTAGGETWKSDAIEPFEESHTTQVQIPASGEGSLPKGKNEVSVTVATTNDGSTTCKFEASNDDQGINVSNLDCGGLL